MQTNLRLAISNEKNKAKPLRPNHNWINCEKDFNKLTTYMKYLCTEIEKRYGA